ncbi:MAG TPA: hypothetical protein VHE83_06630 [Mycobacteriales bacterium]|nr:hypothetical protein [Mycobacteriales bacterium]
MARARWTALAAVMATLGATGLAAAAPAAADGITGASISSVTKIDGSAYPLYSTVVYDWEQEAYEPRATMKISGTSSSGASGSDTTLSVRCYESDTAPTGYYPLATVTPDASGAWTAYIDPSDLSGDDQCRFRAVPSSYDTSNTDFAAYPAFATIYHVGYAEHRDFDYDTPGAGGTYQYEWDGDLSKSYAYSYNTGWCGYYGTYLHDSATDLSSEGDSVFECAAAVYGTYSAAGAVPARAGYVVDTHPAFDSYYIHEELDDSVAGVPHSAVAFSQDPTTGDLAIVEVNDLVNCLDALGAVVDDPSPSTCASYRPAGVRQTRITTLTNGGNTATVRDTYSSTGSAHSLSWVYDDYLEANTSDWKFPGTTSYVQPTAGALDISGWPKAGTTYVRYDSATPDGSADKPVGAITYSAKPTSAFAYGGREVDSVYARSLAAGGSATLTRTYSTEASNAALGPDVAAAEAASTPKVTLNALPATIGTHQVTVTGQVTAGGNGVPSSVVANGVTAPVAPDGTFSVHVVLPASPGLQTVAVLTTDDAGQVAAGSVTTTYANPVSEGLVKVAKTKYKKGPHKGQVAKEVVSVPVACAAFAPATGCTITLKLGAKGKPLAGAKTVHVAPGAHTTVKLTVNAAGIKAVNKLKKGKHLAGNLQNIYTDPAGGTLALKVRSVRLA